jgi:hypothetical protein
LDTSSKKVKSRAGYPGNRAGRRSSYAIGTRTQLVSVHLSERHLALAIYRGEGVLSEGIRRLIEDSAQSIDIEGKVLTRVAAEVESAPTKEKNRKANATARAAAKASLVMDKALARAKGILAAFKADTARVDKDDEDWAAGVLDPDAFEDDEKESDALDSANEAAMRELHTPSRPWKA